MGYASLDALLEVRGVVDCHANVIVEAINETFYLKDALGCSKRRAITSRTNDTG